MAVKILRGGFVSSVHYSKWPVDGVELEGELFVNKTGYALVLKKGYSTVANGSADTMEIPAGEVLVYTYKGSPRNFAEAIVGPKEEVLSFLKK